MRFVAISDTHGKHQGLRLPRGDVLIHAGDISMKGKKQEVEDFFRWFSKQNFPYKLLIAGNHDFFFEKAAAAEIAAMIPQGVTYLQDSGVEINGIPIWGSPVTPWFYDWAFNRRRGEEIRRHWQMIPAGTQLLITHGPAYGFLDLNLNEQHSGCQDLLRTVLTIKPRVHLCGHIHEAYGSIVRSDIRFINASLLDEHYELVHRPIVFDL